MPRKIVRDAKPVMGQFRISRGCNEVIVDLDSLEPDVAQVREFPCVRLRVIGSLAGGKVHFLWLALTLLFSFFDDLAEFRRSRHIW